MNHKPLLFALLPVAVMFAGLDVPLAEAQTLPDTTATSLPERFLPDDLEVADGEEIEDLLPLPGAQMDLNSASVTDLSTIPGLDASIAVQIVRFRESFGKFDRIHDLYAIEGLTASDVREILPFVTVNQRDQKRADRQEDRRGDRPLISGSYRVRSGRRLEATRGFVDSAYARSPWRLNSRLRLALGSRVEINVVADHDPGEEFTWAPSSGNYGLDHLTGNIVVKPGGILPVVSAGWQRLDTGFGVLFSRGPTLGRSASNVRGETRFGDGLRSTVSASEYGAYRGIGFILAPHRSLSLSGLVGYTPRDARIEVDSLGRIRDLRWVITGLHRTNTENERRRSIREKAVIGVLKYDQTSLLAQIAVASYQIAVPAERLLDTSTVLPDVNQNRNEYSLSVSAQYRWSRGTASTEFTTGRGKSIGLKSVIFFRHSRIIESVLSYGSYPGIVGESFTLAPGTGGPERTNSTDWYWGTSYSPIPAVRAVISLEKSENRQPSHNNLFKPEPVFKGSFYGSWTASNRVIMELIVRARNRSKQEDWSEYPFHRFKREVTENTWSGRFQITVPLSDNVLARSRIDVSSYKSGSGALETGVLMLSEVRWSPTKSLLVDARYAVFETEDYTTRIYTYERDLRYVLTSPAFSGSGRRCYVVMRYQSPRRNAISAKFASTRRFDVLTLGSGLDQIEGNRSREISVQVELSL